MVLLLFYFWGRKRQLSAKQGNYWYHFLTFFGIMRSLTGD